MDVRSLRRRRPIPFLMTVVFLIVWGVTAAYFTGLVPGIPKTLPMFTKLVTVTLVLLVVVVLTWMLSLLTE